MKETSTKPPEMVEYGWHFLCDDGRLGYGDDREVRQGETLTVPEHWRWGHRPRLCESGMHASWIACDALKHAPGSIICRVAVWGELDRGRGKFCGRNRHVIWMLPLEKSREVLLAHGRCLETCLAQAFGPFQCSDTGANYLESLKSKPNKYAVNCWYQIVRAMREHGRDRLHSFDIEHHAARNARDWDLEDRAIEAAKECGVFVEDYDPTAMTAAAQE